MNNTNQLPPSEMIKPAILYYGTPVILLSTLNEDGTVNISPISSSWALGDCIVLGLGIGGQAFHNLERHPECVVNIPGPSLWKEVERLAPYTGKYPVPEDKQQYGFTFLKDKFAASGLTPAASVTVKPARIAECPLQIEAAVLNIRVPEHSPDFAVIEARAVQVHAHKDIITHGSHIDPQKWSPLIYNFRHYFGLGDQLGRTFRAEI
ncbi:hypothetical protein C2I18_24725 [Paenibacillus sp. PK3_47]|uniref:flavin reductase family protein n=1 Tax=Paenibacillus sp. PK3_47 TaxID=2072642 RepID=UPI00201E6423|nr:flavin reductase family protein [Paenibacillus sp. PK3_47]UQZ36457.1 hypothetical protein C2I18_24725 [Paenibacillus sp. PK3_47]